MFKKRSDAFLPEKVITSSLNSRLGFSQAMNYPQASLNKSLLDWKMEIDDAPIFRYLYRNFKPRRHLEFGTWQGWGVTYCLEECDATVWTINLPFGEKKPVGGSGYSHYPNELKEIRKWAEKLGMPNNNAIYRTDSLGFIGRHYMRKNLGHRVCQIYCDSREWDIANYPDNFFDSVLIDGGHTPDIVVNDTKKGLNLLRSGGLILWHDFCPDPEVQKKCETACTVVSTITKNYEWITDELKDIFWINPSWILVGVKK